MATGLTAFNTHSSSPTAKKRLDPIWWELNSGGDPWWPHDYIYSNGQPCYGESFNVCGVYAYEDSQDPGYPDLDASPYFVYKPLPPR